MRRLLVIVGLLFLPNVARAVSAEEIVKIAPTRLAWMIAMRQGFLESAIGIEGDDVIMAEVQFRIPPDIHPARTYDFEARIIPGTRVYIVNPKYYAALNRWIDDEPPSILAFCQAETALCRVVDHETGHQIVYSIAQKIDAMNLYVDHDSLEEVTGVKIILEGLGTYFERRLTNDRVPHDRDKLPSSWDDPYWSWYLEQICYEGGYWTVKPIVDTYGQRGIEYILRTPLIIENGDAYTATAAYQKTAMTALAK